MKFSAILNAVQAALQTWASAYGGGAEVAGDAAAAFQVLGNKPAGVRAIVWLSSEAKRGEFEESSMVEEELQVILSRGRSMKLRLGDSHVSSTAGHEPLIDLVEEARDVVRGLSMTADETEVTLDYKGFTYLQDSEGPQDAYQLTFSIGNLMGTPSANPSQSGLIGYGVHSGLGSITNLADDTVTTIPSGTEVYDELNAWTSNKFVAPAAGFYLAEVAYTADFSGGAFEWGLWILNATTGLVELEIRDSNQRHHAFTQLKLAAGDELEFQVFHETGVPRSFGPGSIAASGYKFVKVHRIN